MYNWDRSLGGGGIIGSHIFEEIISLENLFLAWQQFSKGKRKKQDIQLFEFFLENNLFLLHKELKNGSYLVSPYEKFYISDPKLREIHKASVRDRVVFQAVYQVLSPIFEKKFIYDSFSSRLGKGTHAGISHLESFLRKASKNCSSPAFALKLDIKQFFNSIDQKILYRLLCFSKIIGHRTQWLLREIIESFESSLGRGLSLGNVTSQLFANVYLHELDRFVKHKLKIKYYLRYCDDFVIVEDSIDNFFYYIDQIQKFLSVNLKLQLHPKKIIIRKYSQGIDFLGYVLRPHHRVLRTKTKRRLLRKINEENQDSYLGVLGHCNGYKVRKFLDL